MSPVAYFLRPKCESFGYAESLPRSPIAYTHTHTQQTDKVENFFPPRCIFFSDVCFLFCRCLLCAASLSISMRILLPFGQSNLSIYLDIFFHREWIFCADCACVELARFDKSGESILLAVCIFIISIGEFACTFRPPQILFVRPITLARFHDFYRLDLRCLGFSAVAVVVVVVGFQ